MSSFHTGRLTSTDASFLYLERRHAPMHIGAVCLFDGQFSAADYRHIVEAKLAHLPRFRERLVPTPFFFGHATWEVDPDFDIEQHVLDHDLGGNATSANLRSLINTLIAKKLDRSRPLWELHVINGLPDGTTALVSKVHHAMVDGVGGNQILTTILDLSPKGPGKLPSTEPREVPAPPSTTQRVMDAVWDNAHTAIDGLANAQSAAASWGPLGSQRMKNMVDGLRDELPNLARPPKRLPFNKKCGAERDLAWTRFSFAEARAVRAKLGGTVNDVVLAALAGAVRRYCEAHDTKVKGRRMRVMVPVSVRAEGAGADLGNQVSVLPVDVPLGIADPAARIASIRESTRALKRSRLAEGIHMMTQLAGTVPVPLQAAFGAIAAAPMPIFNIVCTNVPGPQIPLYALGVPLREYYPHIPVGFNMGVGCAIFSYNQSLHIGLNSDTKACPDVHVLCAALDEEFAALKAAAKVDSIAAIPLGGVARWREVESEDGPPEPAAKKTPKTKKSSKKTAKKRTSAPAKAKKKSTRSKSASKPTKSGSASKSKAKSRSKAAKSATKAKPTVRRKKAARKKKVAAS